MRKQDCALQMPAAPTFGSTAQISIKVCHPERSRRATSRTQFTLLKRFFGFAQDDN